MRELVRKNPFGRISFLDLRYVERDGQSECIVTLEFGRDEISVGSAEYYVGFSKATLLLETPGFRQIPETRFGAIEKDSFVSVESEVSSERYTSGTLSVSATQEMATKNPIVALKGSGEAGARRAMKESAVLDQKIYRIKPRGEGMWDVKDIDGKNLEGIYINGKPLVQLESLVGANRKEIIALVVVKQKDITFDRDSSVVFPRIGVKEKLLAILTAKSIENQISPGSIYDGKLTMSISKLSDEDI